MFIASLVVVLVGIVGLQMADNTANDTSTSVAQTNTVKAENLALGGIESALLKLDQGQSPVGTFSIPNPNSANLDNVVTTTANPSSSLITVKGISENGVFDATKTLTIKGKFSKNDVKLNAAHASFSGNLLQGIYFEKTGSRTNIIDKLRVTVNQSYCARLVTCSPPASIVPGEDDHGDDHGDDHEGDGHYHNGHGDDDHDEGGGGSGDDDHDDSCWSAPLSWLPYQDPTNSNKVLVCHNNNTISVNKNAVNTHYCHHTDTLGACIVAPELPAFVTCDQDDMSDTQFYTLDEFCSETSGNKKVDRIIMNGGTTVFQSGSIPNAQAVSAASGVNIDINNLVMTTAGNYTIDSIRFDNAIVDGAWYTIQATFLDGSTIYETFQVHTYAIDTTALTTAQNNVVHGTDFTTVNSGGVKDGEVTVFATNNYVFTAQVLGSQMTCGQGGPAASVIARMRINNTFYNAFGGVPVTVGATYTKDNLLVQNDYVIEATASMPSCNNYTKTVLSTTTTLVKFLINGNTPPNTLTGFGGQQPVSAILSPYISGGQISLPQNKVIALFELGNDAGSPNADFQDLVLLITITKQ